MSSFLNPPNSSSYQPPSSTTSTSTTNFVASPSAPYDFDTCPPPQVQSNTYHLNQSGNNQWALPPGWKIAHRDTDGRMYYWDMTTGQTLWSHPLAVGTERPPNFNPSLEHTRRFMETPENASKRPDSHNCCAVFSCIVFPPLGLFALIHSIMTYRSWSQGRYGDSHDHSRQAYNFAWWAIAIFIAFMIYRFVLRDGTPWNIFD